MSIVKMSKMRLVGLIAEKDKILDEIFLSSCAHIKPCDKIEGTHQNICEEQLAFLKQMKTKTSGVLSVLEHFEKNKEKLQCSFENFLAEEKIFEQNQNFVQKLDEMVAKLSNNLNEILQLKEKQLEMLPKEIHLLLKFEKEKQKTRKPEQKDLSEVVFEKICKNLKNYKPDFDYENFAFQTEKDGTLFLSFLIDKQSLEKLFDNFESLEEVANLKFLPGDLVEIYFSFKRSNPSFCKEFENKQKLLEQKIFALEQENGQLYKELMQFSSSLEDLKLFSDFLSYKIEKIEIEKFLVCTKTTFVLECFVPKDELQKFKSSLEAKFKNLVCEELKISAKDTPPTKVKTNKVASQANFVVDMYSVPNYKDVDPTWPVFIFFVLFFGFIVADVGYGVVLMLLGFLLAFKKGQSPGAKRLFKLIGTGGIFAALWGILFATVFGFTHQQWAVLPEAIMPNPQNEPITLLLICLLMGVLQIAVGFLMRGIKLFKQKRICAGITNGIAWVLFLIGGVFASAKFLLDFFKITTSSWLTEFLQNIQIPGLVIMLAGLFVGVVFAGIETKGFSKFSKSFSALYGIINLLSDILSYARLFGLMLSGAIIGQQFNAIALGMMNSVGGYIAGFLIMLVGHSFNIAMSALSAYIHDVRLQYVEFFGKFYEGEGVKFKPFGADLAFVEIKN